MQHGAATAAEAKAYDDRLGIGSINAEASIALAVHLGIFLSLLVQLVRTEVFLRNSIVESGVEVADSTIAGLRTIVLVEGQRVVVHTEPRVAVAKAPECHG